MASLSGSKISDTRIFSRNYQNERKQTKPCHTHIPYVSRHVITPEKINRTASRFSVQPSRCSQTWTFSPSKQKRVDEEALLRLHSYMPVFKKDDRPMQKYQTSGSRKREEIGSFKWDDCPCKTKQDGRKVKSFGSHIVNNKQRNSKSVVSFNDSILSLRCSSVSSTRSSIPETNCANTRVKTLGNQAILEWMGGTLNNWDLHGLEGYWTRLEWMGGILNNTMNMDGRDIEQE